MKIVFKSQFTRIDLHRGHRGMNGRKSKYLLNRFPRKKKLKLYIYKQIMKARKNKATLA